MLQPNQQGTVDAAVFSASSADYKNTNTDCGIHVDSSGEDFWKTTNAEKNDLFLAKSFLMEQKGMTEEQAHRFIQKTSMDHGMKLQKTAG